MQREQFMSSWIKFLLLNILYRTIKIIDSLNDILFSQVWRSSLQTLYLYRNQILYKCLHQTEIMLSAKSPDVAVS